MKTAKKSKLKFVDMPADYAALCRLHLPRPIHDRVDYDNTVEMADVFAGFEEVMTPDQEDYFDLLCTLIEVWDKAHATWPELSPLLLLQYLAEEHKWNGAKLGAVPGVSRHMGAMILRGERAITAEHARKLGESFGMPAGAFI